MRCLISATKRLLFPWSESASRSMLRFPVRYVCMRRSGKGLVSSNVLKKALFRHFYLSADARFIQYFCALGSTDRVADFESVGCRFESYRACHVNRTGNSNYCCFNYLFFLYGKTCIYAGFLCFMA